MIDDDYIIIDDFLTGDLYDEVCNGVKSLYTLFRDSDFNGNEFISLGTPEKLRSGNMKTMPVFLKKYLDTILHEKANLFFQNVLYVRRLKGGLPWHVDSQIKDRVQESGMVKHIQVLQNSLPDVGVICVYYPFIPETLSGGQFMLKTGSGEEKAIDIKPNRMIKIKGCIEHGTTPISTSGDDYRISMVTEQIYLPKIYQKMINKDGFLYDGIFDDVIIDDDTGHYVDWERSGYYKDGKYVVS